MTELTRSQGQNSTGRIDVAVVGAGPVGMALASELVRHGLSVRIVDKEPHPKDYSRAPVFWPRAQEALDLMGVRHLWDGKAVPLTHFHLSVYGTPAGSVRVDRGDSPYPVPILVGQDVSEQILDEHLAGLGSPVERATEATAVTIDTDHVRVTLRKADGSEEMFEAAWVVGCDGAKSLVRGAAGIGWDGHHLKGLMVPLADAKAEWSLPQVEGHAYAALTDVGYFLTLPLPEHHRVIVSVPDTTAEGEQPHASLDDVAAAASAALGGPVRLSDSPWTTAIRYGNFVASTFRQGRALLAGDAAHSIAPLSGQGMNTGVQDAFDLGWKLAYVHKGWAPDNLLDSVTVERKPVAEHLIASTDRAYAFSKNPGSLQKAVARLVAPAALDFEAARKWLATFYTETTLAYADSLLNDTSSSRSPKPGEHAHDGSLVLWPSLAPLRLYDHLRGLHWSLLAFTGRETSAAAVANLKARLDCLKETGGHDRLRPLLVVAGPTVPEKTPSPSAAGGVPLAVDAWLQLHERYGAASGSLVLVRPDGYVAFHRAADDDDFSALDAYLARVLTVRANP